MKKLIISAFLVSIFIIGLSSALVVKSVDSDSFSPGSEGKVIITLENNGNADLTDVTLSIQLSNSQFISVGSSSFTSDIDEDDEEDFSFLLKSSNDIKAGNYDIPYVISYIDENDNSKQIQGSFGVTVSANPSIEISTTQENQVIGQQGKINIKVINKGLGDARFVDIDLDLSGAKLLSSSESYIGTIASDDFETTSFDVLYQTANPSATLTVQYVDFDNQNKVAFFDVPLKSYTKDQAVQLGIIKQSYTLFYILGIVILIILWFIFRTVRKRRKMRQNMQKA